MFFPLHSVPQKSSVLNGVQCPACYAENNGHCEAVLLNCTGAETRCVHVEGTGMHTSKPFLFSFLNGAVCWLSIAVTNSAA